MSKTWIIGRLTIFRLIASCLLFCMVCCRDKKEKVFENISIIWKDGRAISLAIPLDLIPEISRDSIQSSIQVRLQGHGGQPSISGEYSMQDGLVLFKPLIPFTRGLQYEVFFRKKSLSVIEIPQSTEIPAILAIYPALDTVPENLLKIYLSFSKPMAEGQALKYISLQDEKGDSLHQIFLDLQPELWNENRTMLTLWLDPGRIKRSLQPNKLLGPPLSAGKHYQLSIDSAWPDQEGRTLGKTFSKKIYATQRDTVSPSPQKWTFKIPKAGSRQALEIEPHEFLDEVLFLHCVHIIDQNKNELKGKIHFSSHQDLCLFEPEMAWTSGQYFVQIETRLEDLAGNNLIRPFDRDLQAKKIEPSAADLERKFIIP